ncbi:GldG family protein [Mesorhizobium sp. M1066]
MLSKHARRVVGILRRTPRERRYFLNQPLQRSQHPMEHGQTDETWRPEYGSFNGGPKRSIPWHGDGSWMNAHRFEIPRDDPQWPDVYTYTDKISYAPGEEVRFHGSTSAPRWSLLIYKDGAQPLLVHRADNLLGVHSPTSKTAYRDGCDWPVAATWTLPSDLRSGFYRVVSICARPGGDRFVQHHFFVVRPVAADPSRILVLLPTATWTAYNDWGGANHYTGTADTATGSSPVLSLLRPWTRGMVWLPPGAPRICSNPRRDRSAPTYPQKDWAVGNGFSLYYAAAGWAQFDRHFVIWAEANGFHLDFVTQTDLHNRPELLDGYRLVAIAGHDEYWSTPMRLAIDSFVERGGRVARFGANFMWQIRLEGGVTQICYKYHAHQNDPVANTADHHLLTSSWEDPALGWPGAKTFGLNGSQGAYASWGGFTPKGSRGFTVYRPDHWAFGGTELSYGDVFGSEASIFAYEVDGADYTFRNGLPFPTGLDGVPENVQILAMAPAVLAEARWTLEGGRYYVGDADHDYFQALLGGTEDPEAPPQRYGSGMMAYLEKGEGAVFNAGTCEWVMGLTRNEPDTIRITRNVLSRFLAEE